MTLTLTLTNSDINLKLSTVANISMLPFPPVIVNKKATFKFYWFFVTEQLKMAILDATWIAKFAPRVCDCVFY